MCNKARPYILLALILLLFHQFTSELLAEEEKQYVFGWEHLIRAERDNVYYPDKVIKMLDIKPGDKIAEVDPGPGYWTSRLAKAVGPEGRIFAIQAFPIEAKDMDEYFLSRLKDPDYNPYLNITFYKSLKNDIEIPRGTLDMVFLCLNGYLIFDTDKKVEDENINTHLRVKREEHSKILSSIYRALRPGGRLVVIDLYDSPIVRMLHGPSVDFLGEFIPDGGNTDIVVKNYENMGFIFEKGLDIYSNERHRQKVKAFAESPILEEIAEGERPVYVSERFFFVFRKPGVRQ